MSTKNRNVAVVLVALTICFAGACQSTHDKAEELHDKAATGAHDAVAGAQDAVAGAHDAVAVALDKVDLTSDPRLQTALAHIDGIDGAEDKVVSQCTGCGSQMAGSEDHALVVGDYTMHFCSDSCRGTFEADPTAALIEVAENIPQPE